MFLGNHLLGAFITRGNVSFLTGCTDDLTKGCMGWEGRKAIYPNSVGLIGKVN